MFLPSFPIPGSLNFSAFLTYISPPLYIPGSLGFASFLAYISRNLSVLFRLLSLALARSLWLLLCLSILAICRSLSRSLSWKRNINSAIVCWYNNRNKFSFLNEKLLFKTTPLSQNGYGVSLQINASCPISRRKYMAFFRYPVRVTSRLPSPPLP